MEFTEAMMAAYLAAAYLDEPDTVKHTIVNQGMIGGQKISYGLSHCQGWRSTMEDSHVHQIGLKKAPDVACFGVFDGHGGDLAAIYCEANLVPFLESTTYFDDMKGGEPDGKLIGLALTEAFMDMDEDLKLIPEVRDGRDESGSTGVVVCITPNELTIANTGDSRMVLVREGKPAFATEDHKPYNPGEKARVEAAGGVVEMDRVNGDLASSRSFGDFMYKRDVSLPANQQLISVQPDVTILNRHSSDQFIIVACDGLWDVFTNEDAAAFALATMKLGCGLGRCCELLIEEALMRDSRDNISVAVIALNSAPKELGTANKPGMKEVTIDDTIAMLKKMKVNSIRRRSKPPTPMAWVVDRHLMGSKVPTAAELSKEQVEKFGQLMGAEWNEFDETQHKLGQVLGMFPESSNLQEVKYLFWTTNPLAENLSKLLGELCLSGGPVQHRESDHQYRFVPNLI